MVTIGLMLSHCNRLWNWTGHYRGVIDTLQLHYRGTCISIERSQQCFYYFLPTSYSRRLPSVSHLTNPYWNIHPDGLLRDLDFCKPRVSARSPNQTNPTDTHNLRLARGSSPNWTCHLSQGPAIPKVPPVSERGI